MTEPIDVASLSGLPERYIVSKCHLLEQSTTEKLEAYNIAEAAKEIHDFLWDDFADWYIESSKKSLQDPSRSAETQRVLLYVWSACLRLLHPYMPYLTETLWQALPTSQGSLMATSWPSAQGARSSVDAAAIARYEAIQALVRGIRNARAEHKVEPGRKITVMFKVSRAHDGLIAVSARGPMQGLMDLRASLFASVRGLHVARGCGGSDASDLHARSRLSTGCHGCPARRRARACGGKGRVRGVPSNAGHVRC